jgi:hypothetical protein
VIRTVPDWALYRLLRAFRLPVRPESYTRVHLLLSASPYAAVRLYVCLLALLPAWMLYRARHRSMVVQIYGLLLSTLPGADLGSCE